MDVLICVFFFFTASLQSAIPLSPLKITTKVVFLIAAIYPTQQLSAQVCRRMLLPVLRPEFAFTGGTTPNCVVNNPFLIWLDSFQCTGCYKFICTLEVDRMYCVLKRTFLH